MTVLIFLLVKFHQFKTPNFENSKKLTEKINIAPVTINRCPRNKISLHSQSNQKKLANLGMY